MYLTIDQIQAADDLPTKEVDMPEWGGKVLVRGFTRAQYEAIQAQTEGDNDAKEIATLVACVAQPALTPETAAILRGKSLYAYARVVRAIAEVNGTDPGALSAAKSAAVGAPDSPVGDEPGEGSGDGALAAEADVAG